MSRPDTAPRIRIIGETPSLAAALEELLSSAGESVEIVENAREAERRSATDSEAAPRILLVASNTHQCESVRRWREGALGDAPLVLVGTRDAKLRSGGGLHVVTLPLVPREFMELVDQLLAGPAPTSYGTSRAHGNEPSMAVFPGGPADGLRFR